MIASRNRSSAASPFCRFGEAAAPVLEQVRHKQTIGFVVIHHQNAHAGQIGRWRRFGYLFGGLFFENSGKPESGTARLPARLVRSRRTLNADDTAHHFDQLLRDGQSQTCAAVLAGCGAVHLDERRKEFLLLLWGNTNARIGDGKTNGGLPLVFGLKARAQRDPTLVGELDSVARRG